MWRERVLGAKPGKPAGTLLPPSPGPHGRPCPVCRSRDRDYDDIDGDDPFNPQARRIAAHNPPRGQLRSFCSYSSGLGSQTSLQPPAQTISNAPVSEYMYGRAPPVHVSTHRGWGSTATPPPAPALGELDLEHIWVPENRVGRKASKASRGPRLQPEGAWWEGPRGHLATPVHMHPCRCQALPSGQIAGPRSCLSLGHAAPGSWCPTRSFSPGLSEGSFPYIPAHSSPRSISTPCLPMCIRGPLLEKSKCPHPHPRASLS